MDSSRISLRKKKKIKPKSDLAFSGSSSSDEITMDELRSIYKIDRDMYRKLAVNMHKEPLVCMAVMALWLFMEELGYPNVIPMLPSYPSDIINSAFEEEILLVYHTVTRTPPPSSLIELPITLRLIHAVGSRNYIYL
ncbi:hypothetical protein C5167_031257 [Papaver somniferum]|nr:hypothetical protein C5167_031257 [Papaver somniferum]